MGYAFTPEETTNLSLEQKVSIMEALAMGVAADGKTAKAQTDQFDREISAIKWGIPDAEVVQHMQAAVARILALRSNESVAAAYHSIANHLSDTNLREKTFRAVASIMAADGDLIKPELQVLMGFAQVFAMTEEQVKAIQADIAAQHS